MAELQHWPCNLSTKCTYRCIDNCCCFTGSSSRKQQRKYSSIVMTCTLEDSKTPKENLQVNEVLETSTSLEPKDWRFSFIDFILYDILLDDPKTVAAIKRKPLGSITMRSREHYIADRMMESYFPSYIFHTKRHMMHSGKLKIVCAALTNPNSNLEIDSEDLAITGQRWLLTPSPTLAVSRLWDSWWLHTSSIRSSSFNIFFMAIWDVGNGRHLSRPASQNTLE